MDGGDNDIELGNYTEFDLKSSRLRGWTSTKSVCEEPEKILPNTLVVFPSSIILQNTRDEMTRRVFTLKQTRCLAALIGSASFTRTILGFSAVGLWWNQNVCRRRGRAKRSMRSIEWWLRAWWLSCQKTCALTSCVMIQQRNTYNPSMIEKVLTHAEQNTHENILDRSEPFFSPFKCDALNSIHIQPRVIYPSCCFSLRTTNCG